MKRGELCNPSWIACAIMALAALQTMAAPAFAAGWRIDPARTTIGFSIDAVGFPRTEGRFRRFEGRISVDFDHPDRSKVAFRVQSQSVDVGSPSFSDYLRSAAFLNSAGHPSIDFVSTSVEKINDHSVRVTGNLTLLGVTKPIAVEVAVEREEAGGRPRLAFQAETRIRSARVRHELRLSAGLARGGPKDLERGGTDLIREARPARWSPLLIALHWLAGLLTLELIVHGFVMVHAGLTAATAFDLYQSHKSIGFVVLALTAARLVLRFAGKAPPLLGAPWERVLARLVQAALYALTIGAVASGWLVVSTSPLPIPTRFFDLFVIPDVARSDAALFAAARFAHAAAAWSIAGLVALHAAGALKHHVVDRDGALTRMLPKGFSNPQIIRRGRYFEASGTNDGRSKRPVVNSWIGRLQRHGEDENDASDVF